MTAKRGSPPMISPSGSRCASSSGVLAARTSAARSKAASSQARASAREVTLATWSLSFSQSVSKPSVPNAPSRNQSTVCATCATCWATVHVPSTGANVESSSFRQRVERTKYSLVVWSCAISVSGVMTSPLVVKVGASFCRPRRASHTPPDSVVSGESQSRMRRPGETGKEPTMKLASPSFLLAATALSFAVACGALEGDLPASDSPMFRGGPTHPGVYAATGAPQLGGIRWVVRTQGPIRSTPAVAGGRIYFGSSDGNVYAVDLQGHPLWVANTGAAVTSSPAVADGRVFLQNRKGL